MTAEFPSPALAIPAVEERPHRAVAAGGRGRLTRWWRRRPVHRTLVLLHRWPGLLIGLLLIVETTSGAILLYNQEVFRATNAPFYHHTASVDPLSPEEAVTVVKKAHPQFGASWVSLDGGVIAVGEPTYSRAYAVDPGTGRINGMADLHGGVMGFLANLHDCALGCEGYPGFVPWFAHPVPTLGLTFLTGITWGAAVLGVLGLVMIALVLTSIKIWWPGRRRLRQRVRVRTGRGRFVRDYDLHNVVGMLALPFILMWGVTGAAFEFPVVEKAWLAVTGGDAPDPNAYVFTAHPAPKNAPTLDFAQASAAAVAKVPGQVRYVELPGAQAPYYAVAVKTDFAPSAHRAFYSGDTYVYVDSHDAAHTKTAPAAGESMSNRFYDRVFEPTHFGWNVNGWWRLLWFAFGVAPLVLFITGVSTWLFRRRIKKRRRRAAAARFPEMAVDPP